MKKKEEIKRVRPITYEMSEKERREVRRDNKKYERGTHGLKKEDFIKYDKSGNRIGLPTPVHHTFGHSTSLPTRENIEETINTYNKEKNKPIQRKEVDRLETKDIDRPDIKLTEIVKEEPKKVAVIKKTVPNIPNSSTKSANSDNKIYEQQLGLQQRKGNIFTSLFDDNEDVLQHYYKRKVSGNREKLERGDTSDAKPITPFLYDKSYNYKTKKM